MKTCKECQALLGRSNLCGYCLKCRLRHECRVCDEVVDELEPGHLCGWCAEVQEVCAALHDRHDGGSIGTGGLRRLQQARERLIPTYASRAALGQPLFGGDT